MLSGQNRGKYFHSKMYGNYWKTENRSQIEMESNMEILGSNI